ncbi:MAG: flagellin [Oscillospiraceae bacterium]
MIIQHNMTAINSQNRLKKNNSKLSKALEKLSSGYAINRAGDNAAGLAVSEKMRSQIFGIKQSVQNCEDGISFIQTFEGALGETVSIIHRAKSLAEQSANGTYQDDVDREAIQIEYSQLCDEVNHIADTDFNGVVMLNGRRMADKFTFLTEDGIKWLTPSKAEFPKDGFVSTFKKVDGFPDITMSIELLPDARSKLVDDKELMLAFEKLNSASVRSFYDQGVPKFSLEGIKNEDKNMFSIRTEGNHAIISTFTPKSGNVDILRVDCTELPHYASTSATGMWALYRSVATGQYTKPDAATPGNDRFDLSKFEESYVNKGNAQGVTEAERQTYLDWINATPRSTATLVPDDEFDKDTDPLKFVWSLNGQEYQNTVNSNGVPTSGTRVPVYADGYTGGPQIFFDNLRFYYNDEDMKAGANLSLSVYTRSTTATGDGGSLPSVSMGSSRCTDIWLKNGNVAVTLTYDKATDTWSDNFGGSGSRSDYGISENPWSIYSSNYSKNLKFFYEADGKLPDGYQIKFSTSCPRTRTYSSNGEVYQQNYSHTDKSHYWSSSIIDLKMDEYDPANPALGGVDYTVAKHGAKYTFDGRTQPDGSIGVWRDEEGNAVDLADEGIYLPTNLDSREVLKLHDGMTITVNNPTMVGEDYIQADIRLYDDYSTVNAFRRIYENITYTDSLVLQTGARTKDSVNFTFAYSSEGLGGLEADLDCTSIGLGIENLSLATQEKANYAIDKLDNALNKVSMIRSTFGAAQNRLEHKIDNLNNTMENLTSAESRIRDTDMAKEMMEFTKEQILSQSSQSMLAQAESLPQGILNLIAE